MATLSIDAPISPLRQRMQQDMRMRGLGPHTRQDYVRHVRRFAAFLGRAPITPTLNRSCAWCGRDCPLAYMCVIRQLQAVPSHRTRCLCT